MRATRKPLAEEKYQEKEMKEENNKRKGYSCSCHMRFPPPAIRVPPPKKKNERCMQCDAKMISDEEEKKTDLAELNRIYKGKAITLVVRLLRQRCSF